MILLIKKRKAIFAGLTSLLVFLSLAGCVALNNAFREKFPTIAHVHIGHAITGWKSTPGQIGLFQVAEEEADIARTHAEYVMENSNDIGLIKLHVRQVMYALRPGSRKVGIGLGFGLEKALTNAVDHITYAAESDDASENVRSFANPFAVNAQVTLDRCDLILALCEEILITDSAQDSEFLAQEILELAIANVEGVDSDEDGVIGPDPGEYGLKQLRSQIASMTSREDPPYLPVSQRYLFGLVRLAGGKWAFSFREDRSDVSADGYDEYY
ncbi:MAG: hypothetical protein GY941_05775 [Planctomycetes bacterium]|nr:hypothetical protein [Planctomycetota bacterium]